MNILVNNVYNHVNSGVAENAYADVCTWSDPWEGRRWLCYCHVGSPAGERARCDTQTTRTCVECLSDSDCTFNAAKPICDISLKTCTACTAIDNCASGLTCTSNSNQVCGTCNTGFHPSGNICEANTCSCNGGTAVTGASCTSDDTEMCASCTSSNS